MTQKQKIIDLMRKCIETGEPVKITGINNKCGEEIDRSKISSLVSQIKKDEIFEYEFYTYILADSIVRSGPVSQKVNHEVYLAMRDPIGKILPIEKLHKLMAEAVNTGSAIDVSHLKIGESKTRAYVSYVAKKHFNGERFSVSRQGNKLSVIYNKPVQQVQERALKLIDAAINSESRSIAVPDNMSIDLLRKSLSIIKRIPDYAHYRIGTQKRLNRYYLVVE